MRLVGRLANRARDYLLFNPAFEKFWRARMRGKVTSLLYHQVDNSPETGFLRRGGSPAISPSGFRSELQFLREQRVRFLTFGQIAAGEYPSEDECGVALCFDDCFLNNYTCGLDLLEEFGIKATFFQTTAMVDAATLIWEHRLYWHTRDEAQAAAFRRLALETCTDTAGLAAMSSRELVEYLREQVQFDECARLLMLADSRLSSAAELASVARRIYPASDHLRRARQLGHEIGSHGHQHLKRVNISEAGFQRDLEQSGEMLTSILGAAPRCFSYPFDSHLAKDAEFVRRHFDVAATVGKRTFTRNTDPMWLPRFTWPGPAKNRLRLRRWLLTGTL